MTELSHRSAMLLMSSLISWGSFSLPVPYRRRLLCYSLFLLSSAVLKALEQKTDCELF